MNKCLKNTNQNKIDVTKCYNCKCVRTAYINGIKDIKGVNRLYES